MKKKAFGLSGIFKIREYKELVAMQEFAREAREDILLSAEYSDLESRAGQELNNLLEQNVEDPNYFEINKNIHNYIAACNERKKHVVSQREKIKPQIQAAKDKYNIARMDLESIKILKNSHEMAQKKEQKKYILNELQERLICQNQYFK